MEKQTTFKKNFLTKNVDLPLDVAAGLALLASRKEVPTKKYMEDILIAHEKKNSKRNTNGQLQ